MSNNSDPGYGDWSDPGYGSWAVRGTQGATSEIISPTVADGGVSLNLDLPQRLNAYISSAAGSGTGSTTASYAWLEVYLNATTKTWTQTPDGLSGTLAALSLVERSGNTGVALNSVVEAWLDDSGEFYLFDAPGSASGSTFSGGAFSAPGTITASPAHPGSAPGPWVTGYPASVRAGFDVGGYLSGGFVRAPRTGYYLVTATAYIALPPTGFLRQQVLINGTAVSLTDAYYVQGPTVFPSATPTWSGVVSLTLADIISTSYQANASVVVAGIAYTSGLTVTFLGT